MYGANVDEWCKSLVLKKKILLVLSLVPVLKQQFNELRNGERQANRDQKFNLFFLHRKINIEEFNWNLLKIDKSYKDVDI